MYVSWHTWSSCVLLPLPVALVSVRVMAGQVSREQGQTLQHTLPWKVAHSTIEYTPWSSLRVWVKHSKISQTCTDIRMDARTHTHTHVHIHLFKLKQTWKFSLLPPLHTNTVHEHTKTSNSSWDGCKVLSELDTSGDGGVHYCHRHLRWLKQQTVGLLILCNQHLARTNQKTIM